MLVKLNALLRLRGNGLSQSCQACPRGARRQIFTRELLGESETAEVVNLAQTCQNAEPARFETNDAAIQQQFAGRRRPGPCRARADGGCRAGLSTGLPTAAAQTVLRDLGWLAEVAERRTVSTIERAGSDSRALPGRRLQG